MTQYRHKYNRMKLSIELVPASSWYDNVRSNVSVATWARIQRQTADQAGHRCEICGRQGVRHPVEAHEVWAYDDAGGVQRLLRLIALCPDCHGVKHFGRALAQGTQRRLLAWFAYVNGLTAGEALLAIKAAFGVHKQRSSRVWTLDLSVLELRYGIRLDARGIETT
ncbi:MAG: HNH endonuclease signature motif containing protein [Luteimonas sp.]